MTELTITCPSCATEIKLTESLAAPLIEETRQRYEAKMALKEEGISKREVLLKTQLKEIEAAQRSIDEQVSEKLKIQRAAIVAEETKKAQRALACDLEAKNRQVAELQELLEQRNLKLEEAQKEQVNVIRKQRELDDSMRELDLTVEKRVQASLAAIRQKAKDEADDELRLKVIEREEQIASMQRQIDNLKRKAEQGSQQLQGEALELVLEATLRVSFPMDEVEPVKKGELGGDIVQRVFCAAGQPCGTILWDSKRTKNWSDGWLAKLRTDQRVANAEVAVLVSRALAKGVDGFSHVDGVWVTEPRFAIPLGTALRQTLIEVANLRQFRDGQETKVELVYQYLTSPRFRHRVEAIVEKIAEMERDLARERKAMNRLWAKREAQIQGVVESTVGMYGDLQGIAGSSFQEIEGLEVPLLERALSEETVVTGTNATEREDSKLEVATIKTPSETRGFK